MGEWEKNSDLSGEFQGPVAVNGGEAVDARGSRGMVYKPSGPVIIKNFINDKIFRRLGIEQRVGFVLLALFIFGGFFALYLALSPEEPTQMTGDFRIAVVGFSENAQEQKSELGMQIAQDIYMRLEQEFADMELDFVVTVWGPDEVGRDGWVRGSDREARAASAEELAGEIEADLLVYGFVDTTQSNWVITPEFYITSENFYEADEVVGQYELGKGFSVVGSRGTLTRVEMNDKLSPRVLILSQITVGLARYALQDYGRALETFEHVLEVVGGIPGVDQVLYLLMGNAAGKMLDLETSEGFHTQALEIDPEYARAYVGRADVYYLRSLSEFEKTQVPTDISVEWLEAAINEYQKAIEAQNKPALSDITTKVHFGMGQCYLMLVYAGEMDSFSTAIAEFEAVIEDYAGGENPRLRERAAESHGRLGLIYTLSGYDQLAIEHYKLAASLLENDIERQNTYLDRVRKLESGG